MSLKRAHLDDQATFSKRINNGKAAVSTFLGADVDIVTDGDLILELSGFDDIALHPFILQVMSGLKTNTASGFTGPMVVPDKLQVRVNTTHMKHSSQAFRVYLRPDAALTTNMDGTIFFKLDDEPGAAILMLLLVIYGKSRFVPRKLSIAQLCNICTAIDKYMLKDAVELIMDIWRSRIPPYFVQWVHVSTRQIDNVQEIEDVLCVSRQIDNRTQFEAAVKAHLWAGEKSLSMTNKPFPDKLLAKLNSARSETMKWVAEELQRLTQSYYASDGRVCDDRGCTILNCDAAALGLLFRSMHSSPTRTPSRPSPVKMFRAEDFWEQGISLRACLEDFAALNWESCRGQRSAAKKKDVRKKTEQKVEDAVTEIMKDFGS